MRYPASEKLEIIRTVESSHLPVKQPSICYAFRVARFTGGTIFMSTVAWTHWRIIRHALGQSGTAFRMPAAMNSLSLLWSMKR